MALESVKIPQNVYVEDKIIGPVSLRQLFIVGVGAGISYAMYSTATAGGPIGIPYTILLWTPAVIATAFAFLRINDLSLLNIILLMIEHANKPNLRYWSPHAGISINFVSTASKQAIIDANISISQNAAKLNELTVQLQKREEELNKLTRHIDEQNASDETETAPASLPAPVVAAAAPEPSRPVNRERVKAQGLEQARSIDGLSGTPGLESYEHIFPKQ